MSTSLRSIFSLKLKVSGGRANFLEPHILNEAKVWSYIQAVLRQEGKKYLNMSFWGLKMILSAKMIDYMQGDFKREFPFKSYTQCCANSTMGKNQWRSHEGAWVGLGPLIYMSGPLRFLIA